ncbi:hypothetical protein K4K60_001834, partial [Colletotrichum sp. SAR11_57]
PRRWTPCQPVKFAAWSQLPTFSRLPCPRLRLSPRRRVPASWARWRPWPSSSTGGRWPAPQAAAAVRRPLVCGPSSERTLPRLLHPPRRRTARRSSLVACSGGRRMERS